MEVEKRSKISFGTTLDREIFPTSVPHTRFGNDLMPIRGIPDRGPGKYENEEVSNFWYQVKTKITSNRGYSLGARTAKRFRGEISFLTPAPTAYQTATTAPREFDSSYKPFSSAAARFPVLKRDIEEVSPGPGTYKHNETRNRKVDWHQSFGGTPINLPSVTQHSTIDKNTEKLMSTKEEKKYHRRLAYLKMYYD